MHLDDTGRRRPAGPGARYVWAKNAPGDDEHPPSEQDHDGTGADTQAELEIAGQFVR
jgi:hypothetical protein